MRLPPATSPEHRECEAFLRRLRPGRLSPVAMAELSRFLPELQFRLRGFWTREWFHLERATAAEWRPPVLILRAWHKGYYYLNRREWRLHMGSGHCSFRVVERVPLRHPRIQRPFDTAPVAEELARLILAGESDERLHRSKRGRVRVRTPLVLPPSASRTLQDRRWRLYGDLAARLGPLGWQWHGYGWWGPPPEPPADEEGWVALAEELAWGIVENRDDPRLERGPWDGGN
jgi:hypothetical protein